MVAAVVSITIAIPREEVRRGTIIEKGEYQRVQYLFSEDKINTELTNNCYVVVRDDRDGNEYKLIGIDYFVVGDSVEFLKNGNLIKGD